MARSAGAAGARIRRALTDRDVLVALVLAAAALAQVLGFLPIANRLVGAVIALGSTLPIIWRRPHPIASTLVGSAVWLIPAHGFLLVGYVAAFFLYYAVTAYVTDAYVSAATVLIGALASVGAGAEQHIGIGEYAGGIVAVVAPAGVGVLVRRQRERNRRLEELTAHLEREREHRERVAIADERARIARELHDIVSHALSIIVLQADAATAAVERRPKLAQHPLEAISASAHEALTEMRRLLGVLRTEGPDDDREPLPGMAQLPVLLERATAGGVTAELVVEGAPVALPQSLDLTAYRVIQEALTNAVKHAGGAPVVVRLGWSGDHLDIDVRDRGPGPAGDPSPDAHGLVGMRERVRIHGGRLAAGAAEGGGFRVHAVLPIEAA